MSALADISAAGVSIWLDDLDRHRIESGGLASLIAESHVVGVTTNPSIFEKALTSGATEYRDQLTALAGSDVDAAIRALTVADVQAACDLFDGVWRASHGVDGRVSLEVDPRLAHDTQATVDQALELWQQVNRPNLMIKIPATDAGIPAIAHVVAHGISVNVTLIFSVDRYRQVIDAWFTGLAQAAEHGHDLSTIESVASFFVSRVDTMIDPLLGDGSPLLGKAAVANARLAWVAYQESLSGTTWQELAAAGAHPQRPLWASTGVKNPAYDDTMYVIDLVAPGCVNTMPETTLKAVADHGVSRGDTVTGSAAEAQQTWDDIVAAGIDPTRVFADLEAEGVDKFIAAWNALRSSLATVLA